MYSKRKSMFVLINDHRLKCILSLIFSTAAKAAAEKRAKAALLVLRDAAFQRSKIGIRQNAVNCAVGIASGRLPASQPVEEMALKLVMNVLYPKAPDLADQVVASAVRELDRAAKYAIENNDKIKQANAEAMAKKPDQRPNPSMPQSDIEKGALEYVKKPANLFMALCIRRPEIIKDLMSSCKEGAEVLAKAIRGNMPKLARAAAKKYGAAKIAAQVAELADTSESGLLMSFLDNLVPVTGPAPAQELIDACIKIQESRLVDGKKDPRFIIPVLSGMKRTELETRLPFLVATEDNVFKASLHRMSEKLKRQALSFREEVDEEPLLGMTLCEQVVYLHRLDFTAAKIPQKRYLEAIRLCMEYDDVYTDRVIMAALDNISNVALSEQSQELPLAYMRTVILTCSKHETLHSWICHVLLPRLVECQIYNNGRQWEGWMRCARMLENGDGGVSSVEAINQLPEEQYNIYRNKYP
jgi:symplekin